MFTHLTGKGFNFEHHENTSGVRVSSFVRKTVAAPSYFKVYCYETGLDAMILLLLLLSGFNKE